MRQGLLGTGFVLLLLSIVLGSAAMLVVEGGGLVAFNLPFEIPTPTSEGCSVGFWKNDPGSWGPTGYSPGELVGSVFIVPSELAELADDTLLDALNYGGGPGTTGGAQILLQQAVAALLNASHPDINYPRLPADVIADVNTALASNDRGTMLTLAGELDADNNLGCPLE